MAKSEDKAEQRKRRKREAYRERYASDEEFRDKECARSRAYYDQMDNDKFRAMLHRKDMERRARRLAVIRKQRKAEGRGDIPEFSELFGWVDRIVGAEGGNQSGNQPDRKPPDPTASVTHE